MGSIPGSGRSPGRKKWQSPPVFLAWRIPWTEEPGGLQSVGHKELDTTEHPHMLLFNHEVMSNSLQPYGL